MRMKEIATCIVSMLIIACMAGCNAQSERPKAGKLFSDDLKKEMGDAAKGMSFFDK